MKWSNASAAACLAILIPTPAAAFPGSVRWGYANCSTCHFNVGGGGVLTPYGRQLSRELLSTWGSAREAEFLYGASLPSWLALGGDIEFLATSKTGATLRLQQADLEAAATGGRWLAVASAGRGSGGDAAEPMGRDWISRRHYLQFQATPTLSLRAGRFLPNYGVWNGDPSVATRSGLGLHHDSYNVEANWITARANVAVTGLVAGTSGWDTEKGVSFSAGLVFKNNKKVWLSALSRGQPGTHRRAVGLSSVLGIGKHAYLLAQTDLQRLETETTSEVELMANVCLARETVKGLYVLLIDELVRRDMQESGRVSHSYGAGLRWFPRPHLELQLRWRSQDQGAMSPVFLDGFSGFFHFYP